MLCKQVRSLCLVNLFFPQLRIKPCSLSMLESLTPSFFSSPPSSSFIFNSLCWFPFWVSYLFIQCLLLLLGNWQRSTSWWIVFQPTVLPFSKPQQRSWRPLIPTLFLLALSTAGATQSFLAECFLINATQLTVQAASRCKQLLINAGGLWWLRVCNKPLRWEWMGGFGRGDMCLCQVYAHLIRRMEGWKLTRIGTQDLMSLVPMLSGNDSFWFGNFFKLVFCLFCFSSFFPLLQYLTIHIKLRMNFKFWSRSSYVLTFALV